MNVDVLGLKQLRASTGAGMLDCRKALEAAGGDLSAAEALIGEWGLTVRDSRADREAREGRVFASLGQSDAALVAIDCETDFAALSEPFRAAGERIAAMARAKRLSAPDPEMREALAALAAVIKEKLVMEKVAYLACGEGERIEAYVHGEGSVGALVRARIDPPSSAGAAFADERVRAFLHDAALHVAAFRPRFLDQASVDPAYLEEKLAECRSEVEEDPAIRDKPPRMREAIAAGKLRKQLVALSLLDRGFVRDEKRPLAAFLQELRQASGYGLSLSGFASLAAGAD